jgi:hypothetical protein
MKNRFLAITARQSDATLLEILKPHKKDVTNWRNWGDNVLKLTAQEAHKRGLIK